MKSKSNYPIAKAMEVIMQQTVCNLDNP